MGQKPTKENTEMKEGGGGDGGESSSNNLVKREKGKFPPPDYVFVFSYPSNKPKDDSEPPQTCCAKKLAKRAEKSAKRAQIARAKITAKLKNHGLEVHTHQSRDGDEALLAITTPDALIMKHADVMNVRTKLKTGGYLEYETEKHELFEPHSETSFFSTGIRSLITLDIIESPAKRGGAGINVGKALRTGTMLDCFPLHENKARKALVRTWVKDFWKPQPLDQIREYFGEKIAFYFAWLGYFTRWLIYASIIGLIPFFIGPGSSGNNSKWDNVGTPLYCFFLALWSTFFLEFWKRETATLASRWGVLEYEKNERARPEFEGEDRHGLYVDGVWIDLEDDFKAGKQVPISTYYPGLQRMLKQSIGGPVITFSIGIVIAATVSILITRMALQSSMLGQFGGGTVGGIINAIVINVLNIVYAEIAVALNDWENFRTETEYEDNLIAKTFLFQFVNSYMSLFYIAFFKGKHGIRIGKPTDSPDLVDQCQPEIGCMGELSSQLLSLLITRTVIGQLTEILIPIITAKFHIYNETKAAEKQLVASGQAKENLEKMSKIEKEFCQTKYLSTFDDYNEMIILFGYVTLFAAAMPLASLIGLVNNIIEIRTDAIKILVEMQRPAYGVAEDIGTWFDILEVMSILSVCTNMLVLIVTSNEMAKWFGDPRTVQARLKALWTAIFIEHAIFIVKYIIATLIPDVPGPVKKELAEQQYRASLILEDASERLESSLVGGADDKDLFSHKIDESFNLPADIDNFETAEENEEINLDKI